MSLLIRTAAWLCPKCSTKQTTSGRAQSLTMEAWGWRSTTSCEKTTPTGQTSSDPTLRAHRYFPHVKHSNCTKASNHSGSTWLKKIFIYHFIQKGHCIHSKKKKEKHNTQELYAYRLQRAAEIFHRCIRLWHLIELLMRPHPHILMPASLDGPLWLSGQLQSLRSRSHPGRKHRQLELSYTQTKLSQGDGGTLNTA